MCIPDPDDDLPIGKRFIDKWKALTKESREKREFKLHMTKNEYKQLKKIHKPENSTIQSYDEVKHEIEGIHIVNETFMGCEIIITDEDKKEPEQC